MNRQCCDNPALQVDMAERWEAKQTELKEKSLRRTFDKVDEDGSGEIEYEEFRRLCRKLDARIEQDRIDEAWKAIDADGSGGIDFTEFREWWYSPAGQVPAGATQFSMVVTDYWTKTTVCCRLCEMIPTRRRASPIVNLSKPSRRARSNAHRSRKRRPVAAANG